MDTKSIHVIIVTWNGMKWIKRCLDALHESTYPVKVIIVDNGSMDNTVNFVRNNYPEVHIIESDKNLGFGQANNVGIRYAIANGCDFVYLLNQDAYVYPDMFQLLLDEAEKPENQKTYAIYSPIHVNGDVSKMDKQFKCYLKDIAATIVEDQYLSFPKAIYSVIGVPAAGWLLPKRTLETIGGFDPIFFHYGEDHHYFQRVNYHGYKTGVVLAAKMIHDRENYGNEQMAQKDKIFRSIKTSIFLDINLSRGDRFRKLLKLFCIFSFESIKALFKGNLFIMKDYMLSLIRNITKIHEYSVNRKQNKQIGPNWL